jgi:MFS transporter, YNFM family, putative membrane transport protein
VPKSKIVKVDPPLGARIRHGTPQFRSTNLAMFAGGFSTFGLLYSVQPLLPEFSKHYAVSAAQSALSLSLPSAVLAVAMLFAGPMSDAWGRKRVMSASLAASAVIALLTAVAPTWHSLLALRALLGLTLGGMPAVAMAYLSEEVHPDSIGLGMGLYIGGNAAGGMGGRLIAAVVTDFYGWRIGLGLVAIIAAVGALLFMVSLPPSRWFARQPLKLRSTLQRFGTLFRDPGLPWLFALGGVLLGAFVTVYNYITYRLIAPPYSLRDSAVGMIFGVYSVGVFSSSWVGHLAGRLGRRKVLWTMLAVALLGLGLTLLRPLWVIVLGIAVITFGFFGGHSIASSWVGRRSGAAKAQASSIYLFCYYSGSSFIGALGGVFYADAGWSGVAMFVAALFGLGLLFAWRLYHVVPLSLPSSPATETPLP